MRDGASGVDMGRNIWQSDNPVAMIKAVRAIVHENFTAAQAYDLYLNMSELKSTIRKNPSART
jgi:putative autoinducer-2 (AI-2) aldolase